MTANSAGKIFHSNENYEVIVNEEVTEYLVKNSNSGVIEFQAPSLPECIFAAENLNVVLTHRTFEWVAKRAQEQAAKDIGLVKGSGVSRIN